MSVSLVHVRRLMGVAVGLAIASVALPAGTAAADQSYSYSTPGTYALTVPQYAASVNVIASGASGTDGGSTGSATGGTAGNGSVVDASIRIGAGSSLAPGDSLEIVAGAQGGGGGSGGNGDEVGLGGGVGGADSVVSDLSTGNMLAVAGGGGGGGGGAGGSIFASGATGNFGTAGSAGNGSVSLDFTIADVAPTITSASSASVPSASGSFNLQLTASGNPASTFSQSGAPSWLVLNPRTGMLTGAIPAKTVGQFTLTVTADNGILPNATQQFTLHVTTPPLESLAPGTLRAAQLNAFSARLGAVGGIAPYTWSLVSGSLPAGLSLSSSGVISGTPTTQGTTTVKVKVADSGTPDIESVTEAVAITVDRRWSRSPPPRVSCRSAPSSAPIATLWRRWAASGR